MLYRRLSFCCLLIALSITPNVFALSNGGDDVPAWLQQASTAVAPVYAKDVPAVVLQDESQMTVDADGKVMTVSTYAVRILTHEGRKFAQAHAGYDTDSGKVREMHAWLIRPGGQVKRYGKDQTADVAASMDDVYDESRIKVIDASDDADAGAVFGYQVTSEERTMFPQTEWSFQERVPVIMSRCTLTLPANWSASSITFNHDKIEPKVSGSTYTWELHNLAPIEPEVASPEVSSLAPRIAISYASPQGSAGTMMGAHNFANWTDVSRWYSELSDPQAVPDDAVAAKARELTINAKTELEKIQAIGAYVQNLQYISVQLGVGRYRPHSAAQVFAKRYGDCKDKANLMRAMLKAVGLQAFPILIWSGDPTYVREEWASPSQFNHCIVAVKVSDETQAATVIKHPALGRLLIFDATDDNTPVGDLPIYEQNSFALVAAGDAGALMRMPTTPPEANRMERQAEVSLAADGSITANVHERSIGQAAVVERRGFRHFSRPEYQKLIEGWITRGATGAKISKVEPTDNHAEGRFALDVDFSADNYGQLMQNHLLVFKPAIVSRRDSVFLTEPTRKHPVIIEPNAYTETVHFKLPDGFNVDELPDPTKLETAFGSYVANYEVKDGQLYFTRKLIMRAATISPDQYQSVRNFYEHIRAAEQAPVVLAKK